ncbi:MAG: HesA/MoeB/ThiF family protein [Firmicutes bacterium]|nr:HesA/MoeB/ThiF family protein [Bacillota bacterium]
MERYRKNIGMLSEAENLLLREKKAAVIGCGGLGGYILEMLARLGVGALTVVDGDVFAESNLNRQLLCRVDNLGKSKALEAAEHIRQINPHVQVTTMDIWLSSENAQGVLQGHDVVVDALDNVSGRKLLQAECARLGIPMVHGAIAGWYGQVATILPGDDTLDRIYTGERNMGLEEKLGNPSFTPALVASLQVAEVTKLLIGRGDLLSGGTMLFVDTLSQEFYRLPGER